MINYYKLTPEDIHEYVRKVLDGKSHCIPVRYSECGYERPVLQWHHPTQAKIVLANGELYGKFWGELTESIVGEDHYYL